MVPLRRRERIDAPLRGFPYLGVPGKDCFDEVDDVFSQYSISPHGFDAHEVAIVAEYYRG